MSEQMPGWEGSQGPFEDEYTRPHVYARDIHSGAGNCVCGSGLGEKVHVQAAPGVDTPEGHRQGSFDHLGAGLWPENPDDNVDNPVTNGPKMNPQKKQVTPPQPKEPNLLEPVPNTSAPSQKQPSAGADSGSTAVKNSFLNVFDF